jgi:tripartite-type tricarboxylate transporter receptor subunit TctC
MPARMARSAPLQPLEATPVTAVIRAVSPACQRAGKAQKFVPLRGSYGKSRIKAIAILSKNRSSSMPDLPSAHEQGLTDLDMPSWYAIFLPNGTPGAIVRKLNGAMVAAMNTPVMQERLRMIGSDLVGPERRSPEYLASFVADEIKKWEGPIRASGVQF